MWDEDNDCYHCDWCGKDPYFTFFNSPNEQGEVGYISFLTLGGYDGDCEYMEDKPILKDSIIEQYTGLTDKNGAKIFEGDVLMYEGSYEDYVVLYRDDLSRFCVRRKSGGCTSDLSSFYTIIGNIHEGDK